MTTQTPTREPIRKPCRGAQCGAVILIVPLTTGNTMPIDPEPVPGGRARRLPNGLYEVLGRAAAEAAERAGERLYETHFKSCPNGPNFRTRSRR